MLPYSPVPWDAAVVKCGLCSTRTTVILIPADETVAHLAAVHPEGV